MQTVVSAPLRLLFLCSVINDHLIEVYFAIMRKIIAKEDLLDD
ncbi:MAG: hypothetical protein LZT29_04151 [Pantoea stewartii]|nr:MAG: hypothetical protein LZT29_04151 [Pantoea stewartii]